MRATCALAAALLTLGSIGPPAVAADREAFARAIAEKLIASKTLSAKTRTHTTDFQGDSLGCITFTTWELRDLGYRGHISGEYVGDGCYDVTICGVAESVCVE